MENNLLGKIANAVSTAAPLLGSVLGSPFAGIGISLLSSAFGVDNKDTQALLDKIVNDPEAALKLKQLEYTHQESLAQIASTDYSTEVTDRKSAREREISLHDYVPTFLALGFLLNYAAMQFYCVMHESSANDIISARFQDVLIMIISYYFGSSHKGLTK